MTDRPFFPGSKVLLVAGAVLAAMPAARAAGLPAPTGLPTVQPVPNPHPYDTAADAKQQVDAAFSRAKLNNRTVLIDFGANWCPDCRMLDSVMNMPQLKPWAESHFEEVKVDVDRFNRNLDIPARWNVKLHQIPTVLLVTPDGRLLDRDGTEALGNARAMTPQSSVDLLASWDARR